MQLEDLKIKLKKMIAGEGISACIAALKEVLPERSERFEDVLLVESRQNEANRQRLRNLISNEDLQITYARIREDLMGLIDLLNETDFEVPDIDDGKIKTKPVKKGSILHRIPGQMQLNTETKCIVRIALDEEVIIKNIDLDEDVVLKSIRVSDIMQVALIDPSDEHPFKINAISSAEQFVDEDDFTEWIFYVTPVLEGTFPLLLKVAVIELLHGKERKREIVLEESIHIVTGTTKNEKLEFQHAGYKLAFGEIAPPSPQPPNNKESSKGSKKGSTTLDRMLDAVDLTKQDSRSIEPQKKEEPARNKSRFGLLKKMSMTLVVLAAFTGAAYAIAPAEVEWLSVKYLSGSAKAYADYIEKFEKSRHLEEAYFRKAKLDPQLGTLREYVRKYPKGKYLPSVQSEIRQIEKERFESIQLDPSRERMQNYLETFPDGAYSIEVKKKINTLDRQNTLRERAVDAEELLWQQILKKNEEKDLRSYIQQYPNGKYTLEAKKRLTNLLAIREINRLKNANPKELEGILKRFPESDAEPLIKTRIERLKKKKNS